jgi:hypothetical protein
MINLECDQKMVLTQPKMFTSNTYGTKMIVSSSSFC